MQKAKIFLNGQSQAVRLPREFRFKGTEVYIRKVGNAVVLLPKSNPWNGFFESLEKFSSDFLNERSEPPMSPRKKVFR